MAGQTLCPIELPGEVAHAKAYVSEDDPDFGMLVLKPSGAGDDDSDPLLQPAQRWVYRTLLRRRRSVDGGRS